MVPRTPESEPSLAAFLAQQPNSIWLAEGDGQPQTFLRFQRESDGAARIIQSPETIAITGAYTRPAWRGRGAAPALLDAALRDYAARGFRRMSVDYETINPEALAFWPRYFTPVAVSLVRVVEYV
jgi:GNAT superfamily N-acetyltransferase